MSQSLEEANESNASQAARLITQTIIQHCDRQIGILSHVSKALGFEDTADVTRASAENEVAEDHNAPADEVVDDQSSKDSHAMEKIERDLEACIQLYSVAKANAEAKVNAALASEFSPTFGKTLNTEDVDVDRFLSQNKNDLDIMTDHLKSCTSEVAKAESAAMKFLDQKFPVDLSAGAKTAISEAKSNFETESRHFKKKVGLCILGAVLILAAVALALASHGLLGPVAAQIAAKGVATLGAAAKMSISATAVSAGLGGAGLAAVAGAGVLHLKGDKQVTAAHMKKAVQEAREVDEHSRPSSKEGPSGGI